MTASASQLSGLAPPTPLPCERCGHSPPTARVAVGGKRVCILCADQLARDARPAPAIWPTLLVFATFLLSPLAPPVLAAINWARLGDRRRVRDALGLVVLGAICAVGQLVTEVTSTNPNDLDQQLPFVVVTVGLAVFATMPLRRRYMEHVAQGGKRAGVGLALIITIGMNICVSVPVVGYLLASGKVTLEQLEKKSSFLDGPPASDSSQPAVSAPPPTAGSAT